VENSGALAGITVLDLSRVLAGPWAGQLLADLGADVIKVENPDGGDDTRHWGPPWIGDRGDSSDSGDTDGNKGESAYYLCANRGKRGVTLDLKTAAGREQLERLVEKADVLIENFRVGTAAKLGIGYEHLSAVNPRLVYCSISGFGQTGPYRDQPGYDFLVQAMGGLMSVTGEPDGAAGAGPQKIGVALSDILTGLYASNGILAALAERERSGRGQYIDVALLDVTAACLANQATNYLVGGVVPTRLGNAHPNIVPYQSFASSDGHFILAVGNDGQFRRLCNALGAGELADDPRFADNASRVAHRDALSTLLQAHFQRRPSAHWLALCKAHDVPAGPINTIDQVFQDPQLRARDMVVEMTHRDDAALRLVGNPLKLSRTPVSYRRPPPLLGEHNDDILDG
jgi:crotonobetainyl-CoA:carnitine CoA-transferase CaiB-like acyl-CoA transferase